MLPAVEVRPSIVRRPTWGSSAFDGRALLAAAVALGVASAVAWWYGSVVASAGLAAASLTTLWLRAPKEVRNVTAVATGFAGASAVAWIYGAVGAAAAFVAAALLVVWCRAPAAWQSVAFVAAALALGGGMAWWYGWGLLSGVLVAASASALWLRWPILPKSSAAIVLIAAALVVLSAAAWAVGLGAASSFAAVGAALALGIWSPIAATAGVFALAGAFGGFGGHWTIPGSDVPVFEVLLVAGAAGSAVWLRRNWKSRSELGTKLMIAWMPAAAYAVVLLAFFNHRDFVSGAREALLLAYPLLIAAPMATVDPQALRSFVERRGYQVLTGLAIAATVTGAINLAIGNTVPTSTGQPRSLSSEFSGALGAALLAGGWLAIARKRFRAAVLLGGIAATGLLMVNHRSAYLAVGAALTVVVLSSDLPRVVRANPGRSLRVLAIGLTAIALVLTVTPLGRDGVERFGALFDRSDENYGFREDALARALEKDNAGEVIFGTGVGLQPTDLGADYVYNLSELSNSVHRAEAHNSFAAIYQRAGIVGLLLMVTPIVFLVREMVRKRKDPTIAMFLAVTVFMTVMALFNVVLENSFFGIWFWFPLFIGGLLAAATVPAEDRSILVGGCAEAATH